LLSLLLLLLLWPLAVVIAVAACAWKIGLLGHDSVRSNSSSNTTSQQSPRFVVRFAKANASAPTGCQQSELVDTFSATVLPAAI